MSDDLTPIDVLPEPESEAPGGRKTRFGLAGAVMALFAAGVFAIAYLAPNGNTPEDAVRELAAAVSNEDLLGVLDALPPSERDVLRDGVVDITDELRRLEVIDEDADLSGVQGIDIEIKDLTLDAATLGDGVTLVDVHATATFAVRPSELPVGSFADDGTGAETNENATTTEKIDDFELVTIEEGGRWYVSLFYSLAERARQDAGAPTPDFGNGIAPEGAESPQAAVRGLVEAAVDFDARRAITLMPPDEGRVLHDYAPLFLDDIERDAAEARSSSSIDVTRLDLSSKRDGDLATVAVDAFAASAIIDGQPASVEFDGKCAVVTIDGEAERSCEGDRDGETPLGPLAGLLDGTGSSAGLAFVAVERDGGWYVSPLRTIFNPIVEMLRGLERGDLDQLFDGFGGFSGAEESASSFGWAADPSVPAPTRVGDSDREVQSQLRNALVAMKVAYTDTGEWPNDVGALAEIEPSVIFLPGESGFIPPVAVAFDVDGDTVRLASRAASGCFYISDDAASGRVSYAVDQACGALDAQDYSDDAWG